MRIAVTGIGSASGQGQSLLKLTSHKELATRYLTKEWLIGRGTPVKVVLATIITSRKRTMPTNALYHT